MENFKKEKSSQANQREFNEVLDYNNNCDSHGFGQANWILHIFTRSEPPAYTRIYI